MFPKFKVDLTSFCLKKDGPKTYAPLVNAIQNFYLSITEFYLTNLDENNQKIYQFDTRRIRRELFKNAYI